MNWSAIAGCTSHSDAPRAGAARALAVRRRPHAGHPCPPSALDATVVDHSWPQARHLQSARWFEAGGMSAGVRSGWRRSATNSAARVGNSSARLFPSAASLRLRVSPALAGEQCGQALPRTRPAGLERYSVWHSGHRHMQLMLLAGRRSDGVRSVRSQLINSAAISGWRSAKDRPAGAID